jgi:predicted nucleic acid-binding Zn ribbon protein
VLQGINEAPLKSCPECMGPLQKLLYPVGVIFKGSGFYTTDYKGGSKPSSDGAGKSDKETTTSDSSKKESTDKAAS